MCFRYVFISIPRASFARSRRRRHTRFYTKHTVYLARKKYCIEYVCRWYLLFVTCLRRKKAIYPFGLDGQIRSVQILNDASVEIRAYAIVIIILGENHIMNEKWKLLRIIGKWLDVLERIAHVSSLARLPGTFCATRPFHYHIYSVGIYIFDLFFGHFIHVSPFFFYVNIDGCAASKYTDTRDMYYCFV